MKNNKKSIVENIDNLLINDKHSKMTVKEAIGEDFYSFYMSHLEAEERIVQNIQRQSVKYTNKFEDIMNMKMITFISTYGSYPNKTSPAKLSDSFERTVRKNRNNRDWKTKQNISIFYLPYPIRIIINDILLFLIRNEDGTQNTAEQHVKLFNTAIEQLQKQLSNSNNGYGKAMYKDIRGDIKSTHIQFLKGLRAIWKTIENYERERGYY